ncbi:PREDICTED: M-phase inducer phosphatase 1 isoform X1 [Thamnophis sirtalis]|uniref:M-phase inducer phosphatase n=1 Tax=Thamnophis sirtalis TaxID=35019 RepID=A0A6I9YG02_9SAUR|nr:PREDICTED: M-phase inducer phosphatase 1 isoform X1 [Thamnophis sirtalis]
MEPAARRHHSHRRRLLLGDAEGPLTRRRSLNAAGSTECYVQMLEVKNANMKRTSSSDSTDSGCCMDSPALLGMNDLEESFRLPMRRMHSLPHGLLGCSPALKRNHSVQLDCNVFQPLPPEENKENEHFEFKKPTVPASRGSLHLSSPDDEKDPSEAREDSNTVLKVSSSQNIENDTGMATPLFPRLLSQQITETENDDGFLEMMDGPDNTSEDETASDMSCLWTAPLMVAKSEDLHSQQQKLSNTIRNLAKTAAVKRTEKAAEESVPPFGKRRRNTHMEDDEEATSPSSSLEIGNVLDQDQRDLIGDFSKSYLFHTVDGKHQDLKYINPEMIVAILNGNFSLFITQCVIIDCRFPYEYDGGHIKGAINLPMEQDVEEFLLKKPLVSSSNKRIIVVFHCEFSSERAPRMCRFVRERDRLDNQYPALHYPELYILKGGYKDFFLKCKSYCEPQSYRPMHHKDFKEDLRTFRTRSRTWAGEKSKREHYSRLKKL